MNWQQYITPIFEICILPLLGILTKMLIDFLKTKSQEVKDKAANETATKYIDMLTNTITSCVMATNQTYVETLKAKGEFTKEAQKEAFTKTYENVMGILSTECKMYLENTFGDLQTYITNKIEAEVKANKPQ